MPRCLPAERARDAASLPLPRRRSSRRLRLEIELGPPPHDRFAHPTGAQARLTSAMATLRSSEFGAARAASRFRNPCCSGSSSRSTSACVRAEDAVRRHHAFSARGPVPQHGCEGEASTSARVKLGRFADQHEPALPAAAVRDVAAEHGRSASSPRAIRAPTRRGVGQTNASTARR